MRKNYILLFFISATFLLNAQSFYRGALVIDVNTGIEIYNTTYKYKIKNNNNILLDTSITDRAGSTHFAFGAEIGLHKRFGLGLKGKFNSFLSAKDEVTKATPTAKSADFMVFANYHAVTIPHFDLILGGDLGYSGLTYKSNDTENIILKGTGSYASLYINPRIYIKRFGFNLKIYAPFVNYNNLTTNNPEINNYYLITKWKGNGTGVSIGIQYRFLKLAAKAVNTVSPI